MCAHSSHHTLGQLLYNMRCVKKKTTEMYFLTVLEVREVQDQDQGEPVWIKGVCRASGASFLGWRYTASLTVPSRGRDRESERQVVNAPVCVSSYEDTNPIV